MRLSRRPSVVSGDGSSLAASARLTVDAARLLVEVVGATSGDIPELDERVGTLHRSAGRLAEELTDRLAGDLVLPFERTDLQRVARSERTVVHGILRIARTLLADRTAPTPAAVARGADDVLRATELLVVATGVLGRPRRLSDIARELERLHADLETRRQQALAASATSGDRLLVILQAGVLGEMADVAAGCSAGVVDMRILAAGAGRT